MPLIYTTTVYVLKLTIIVRENRFGCNRLTNITIILEISWWKFIRNYRMSRILEHLLCGIDYILNILLMISSNRPKNNLHLLLWFHVMCSSWYQRWVKIKRWQFWICTVIWVLILLRRFCILCGMERRRVYCRISLQAYL